MLTPADVRCDRCALAGKHLCMPRAQRVVEFYAQVLVHTKGRYARQPFILDDWQRDDIIVPIFGRVEWSEEYEQFVRVHDLAWIELGRKNGKSELLAGAALVLLVADDEEGAEVYGCAMDREQARVVYDVAERMVELSPLLRARLTPHTAVKRLVDQHLGGVYAVISADAPGNLGKNPSGIVFDEVITQPDDALWTAMRTASGTRAQLLMIAATTAGDDQESFAAHEHEYSERVSREPEYDPHRFVYMRNTPKDADPFDEKNWKHANPALGTFLSREALRKLADEAKNDPVKETGFRQFRMNQWVQAATRAIPRFLWDACTGPLGAAGSPDELDARARGQRCWGGLDLSAKYDLTALCWLFPSLNLALWRFWLPEEQVPFLDKMTGGAFKPWVDAGWIQATPGATIDYQEFYKQVDADRESFKVQDLNYDPNMAAPIIRELEDRSLKAVQVAQGFALSEPIKELLRMIKARELVHGGNPVAGWCAENVETKQDHRERLFFVKPRRGATGKRIDGILALTMAVDGVQRRGNLKPERRRVVGF